jgi:predicted transposase YbfD/YdcC
MIEAERFIGDAVFVETRYYLSSLSNDAQLLNEAVRSHGSVENSLHWVLDVTGVVARRGWPPCELPYN